MMNTAKVVIAVIHVVSSELSMFLPTRCDYRSQYEDSIDKPI